jgi:hypothetical protein
MQAPGHAALHAWLVAFAITVAIEMPIVVRLARASEPRVLRRVGLALAANSLTHPVVWFGFPALGLSWPATTALSETWAWLGEAALYRLGLARARGRSALAISLVANLSSFAAGLARWGRGVSGCSRTRRGQREARWRSAWPTPSSTARAHSCCSATWLGRASR